MNRLILLRHGKAERDSESGEDFDRPLAPRGVAEAALIGQRLAAAGFAPDLALVSSAARTRETWEAAQPAFPDAYARFERDLYLADATTILRTAQAHAADHRTVVMVGHNPGLQDLAARLMAQAAAPAQDMIRIQAHFPTSTAVVMGLDDGGEWRFDALLYSRDAA